MIALLAIILIMHVPECKYGEYPGMDNHIRATVATTLMLMTGLGTKSNNRDWKTLLVTLWILLSSFVGTTASIDKTDDTLSLEKQGIVLTPKNFVISGSNKIFTSLFVKIMDPLANDREAKMLCVPQNCIVTTQVYENYIKNPTHNCIYLGHNEQIQLIKSHITGSYKECVASCLIDPECQAVQWKRPENTCVLRSDSVDPERLVVGPTESVELEVDIKCLEKNISRAELCSQKGANLYTTLRKARDAAIHQAWDENIKRFNDLKSAYDIQIQNSDRYRIKRNPALVALPVVGLLASFSFNFFNRHEIQRLQKHVNQLDHKFSEFTQQVHGEFVRQREFNKDVLWLLKDYQTNTERRLRTLQCDVTTLAAYATQEHLFEEYREKIGQLFHGVNTGVLTQPISPAILSTEDLQYFVQNNPIFNNSIYTSNSELLLRAADITLVRIRRTENSYTLHFVLSTMFVENDAIFPLYEPAIVPVKSNDTCLKVKLPKRIYLKEDLFLTAEHSECTTRPSGLLICLDDFSKEQHPQTIHCLNEGTDCETEEVKCQPHIVQVSAGALIFRSSLPVYGISRQQAGHLLRLDTPEVETSLHSWKKYSQIQVAQRVIYGIQPESTSNTVDWHTKFDTSAWIELLNERAKEHQKTNLSRINELIEKQDEELKVTISRTEDLESNKATLQLVQLAAFISLGLWIITIIYLWCRRNSKYRQTIREMRETVSMLTTAAMASKRQTLPVSYREVQQAEDDDKVPQQPNQKEDIIGAATPSSSNVEVVPREPSTPAANQVNTPRIRKTSPNYKPPTKPKPTAKSESSTSAPKNKSDTPRNTKNKGKSIDDLIKNQ